jgi:DNA repair exonuclease SbcCD ATPase subunit
MIIQALQAQNFRQFLHLNIQLIPTNGLIVVVGGSETGKSAIGEAITFALFGVTDRVTSKASYKLVRWGQSEAIVQLAFQINDKPLLIERTITADGHMSVVLWDRMTGQVIADAAHRVQAVLQNSLGYGYKVFSQTFYWNQQLTEAETADLEAVEAMAGVQIYQQVHTLVEHDASIVLTESERLERAIKLQQVEAATLTVDPLRLTWLQETRAELSGSQQQHLALAEQINEEAQSYERRYPQFNKLKSRINRLLSVAGVMLLTMIVLLVLAAVSIEYPEWLQATLARYSHPTIWGAALLGVGAVGIIALTYRLSVYDLNPLHSKAGLLAQRLYSGYRIMSTPLDKLLHPATVDWLNEKNLVGENAEMLMDMQSLANWSPKVENYLVEPTDLHHLADGLAINLQRRHQFLSSLVSRIEDDIHREQAKTQDTQALQQQEAESQSALRIAQTQLQVYLTAQGLAKRAQQQAAQRFNNATSQSTRPFIEIMTQGQYQGVELAENGLLYALHEPAQTRTPFEQLSPINQRQIAMALRFNLAKALATAHKNQFQCLFWDMPLINFTEPTFSQTLASLRGVLGAPITQLWVTLPYVPENIDGLALLDCRSGDDVLDIKLAGV